MRGFLRKKLRREKIKAIIWEDRGQRGGSEEHFVNWSRKRKKASRERVEESDVLVSRRGIKRSKRKGED